MTRKTAQAATAIDRPAGFVDRFWSKVTIGERDACWLWTGAASQKKRSRYGSAWVNGTSKPAHSVALALSSDGVIPAGVECCHRCDTPLCCNPAHLFWGSHDVNMKDYAEKRRRRQLGIANAFTLTKSQTIVVTVTE